MARQQNTPGVGVEYEISVPAYFALTLNNNKHVKNFAIRSNVAVEFGNMDDVVIDIEMTDDTTHFFAIQLKHKEKKNKKLIPTNFEGKGNFSLEKYCKAFKDMTTNRHYHFILYTNSEFNSKSREQLTHFRIMAEENCPGRTFFDTSSSSGSIYRFGVNDNTPEGQVMKVDYEEFFRRFTVYIGQKNFEDLEEEIFGILKNKSAALSYLDFFRRWHQSRFTNRTIDKKTINIHLVDIFVSEFVIAQQISNQLFDRIVKEYDITIIEECVESVDCFDSEELPTNSSRFNVSVERYIDECKIDKSQNVEKITEQCLLHLAKKYKLVDKCVQHVGGVEAKLLHYFFDRPLLVNFNRSSEDSVYIMFEHYHCKDTTIRFVLIGSGIDVTKLSNFTVFQTLDQLSKFDNLYTEALKECRLSMQGKNAITLEQLLQTCGKIDFVEAKDVLRMLRGDYAVGEEKETLPNVYIHRKVSTNVPKVQQLLNPEFVQFNTVVIDFDGKLDLIRGRFEDRNISIIKIEDYYKLEQSPSDPFIISVNREYSVKELDEIRTKNKTISFLFLKMIDVDTFIIVLRKNNDLSNFDKIVIDEDHILDYFTNKVNIVCAQPGMGKSTMFKLLKNQSQLWSVMVDLKAHNTFLQKKRPLEEVLFHFLDTEDTFLQHLKTAFFDQKKVVFFLDGLDELVDESIVNILDYSEEIATKGFHVWISSRQNLEGRVVSRFSKTAMHIVEVDEDAQKEYIRNRLSSEYNHDEIEQVMAKIFGSSDVVNNGQVLGIPLQLYVITQIFLDDRHQFHEMTKNIFVLTKMYKFFFDGRYKHSIDKQESKNPHLVVGEPEDYFEKYEILALQFLFDDDVLEKLQLDTRRSRRFLERIKDKKDPLGIIVAVNSDGKAVFEHFTYAEYFACVFLTFNFDRTRILQEHLFSDRYKNLLLVLNVMLAEDNPLHLAIIYKDFEQMEVYRDDDNVYDKGGRTPLHLAVIQGVQYPGCYELNDSGWFFMMSSLIAFIEDILNNRRMMSHVTKFDPLTPDKLFNWTCLEYAFKTQCLISADVIMTKQEICNEAAQYLDSYKEEAAFSSFCSLSGSVNLLSTILGEKSADTMTKWLKKSLLHDCVTYCFFQKIEILRFWLEHGVPIDGQHDGNTALLLAARKKLLDVVLLLIEGGASIDARNAEGDSLLHCAVTIEEKRAIDYAAKGICRFGKDGIGVYCISVCKSIDLVKVCIERGVEVDSRNQKGNTPLHRAAENGDEEVVVYLLEKGADGFVYNNEGLTSIQICLKGGKRDLAQLILSKGTNIDKAKLLQEAMSSGDVETSDFLRSEGVSLS